MDYGALLYSLFILADKGGKQLREVIALANSLPGFRKHMMRIGGPITLFMPVKGANDCLKQLFEFGCCDAVLDFIRRHIVSGRLTLRPGQSFRLTADRATAQKFSRYQAVDPSIAVASDSSIAGRIESTPIYLSENILVYECAVKYGIGFKNEMFRLRW